MKTTKSPPWFGSDALIGLVLMSQNNLVLFSEYNDAANSLLTHILPVQALRDDADRRERAAVALKALSAVAGNFEVEPLIAKLKAVKPRMRGDELYHIADVQKLRALVHTEIRNRKYSKVYFEKPIPLAKYTLLLTRQRKADADQAVSSVSPEFLANAPWPEPGMNSEVGALFRQKTAVQRVLSDIARSHGVKVFSKPRWEIIDGEEQLKIEMPMQYAETMKEILKSLSVEHSIKLRSKKNQNTSEGVHGLRATFVINALPIAMDAEQINSLCQIASISRGRQRLSF